MTIFFIIPYPLYPYDFNAQILGFHEFLDPRC